MRKPRNKTCLEKRNIGLPGGPSGPFYSVVTSSGRIIAMQIPDKQEAELIVQIPELVQLRFEWASIINSLAVMVLDGTDSNGRDYAEEMISTVIPYLP